MATERRAATGIRLRRGEPLTADELNDYITAYTEHEETLAEIGARHQRSIEYVRRALREAKVQMRPAHGRPVDEEMLFEMATMYANGISISAIARSLYSSRTTVHQALEKFDVPLRESNVITPEEEQTFKRLYQQGMSLGRIAEETGRSSTSIRMRLIKLGVPLRPHGGANGNGTKSKNT